MGAPKAPSTARASRSKKCRFLASFAELGTITHAAEQAGIARRTHYEWLARDPDYAAAFAEAEEQAIDSVEREILRRAIEGVEEPVYHGGQQVGTIRRYSDTLLIFVAKGLRPEKYRERISIVSEESVDAEIRRLSAELERRRAEAGEDARAQAPPG